MSNAPNTISKKLIINVVNLFRKVVKGPIEFVARRNQVSQVNFIRMAISLGPRGRGVAIQLSRD